MKMESVEFYAQLLYQSKMLGGPKEFDQATVQKLYEIRRKMGLPGKHPANLCLNKNGMNCHNCGGSCSSGHEGIHGSTDMRVENRAQSPEVIAEITRRVLEQLNK